MQICLTGLPGSGKTLQSKFLAQMIPIPRYSVSELACQEAQTDSELGQRIRSIQQLPSWQPLPDDIAIALYGRIGDQDFFMDGFPRSLAQWQWLKEQGKDFLVFYVDTSEAESRRRFLERGDASADWESRIALERDRIPAVLQQMQEDPRFFSINGDRNVLDVYEDIFQTIARVAQPSELPN
ncbi:MAG TPA: nucleoside monophosphate kinase [Leptolyngbyaceae cyanobacterium]